MPQVHDESGRFAIVSSSAKMPSSCWGKYCWVGVVRLAEGFRGSDVRAISDRTRTVEEVLWGSGGVSVGRTERCAFARAVAEAREVMQELAGKGEN